MSDSTVLSHVLSQLIEYQRETAMINSINALLNWDERTGLPVRAGEYRAEQIAYLAGVIHQRNTATQYGDWLNGLMADDNLMAEDQSDEHHREHATIVRHLYREYRKQVKIPESLVREISRQSVLGQQAWGAARADNAFNDFQPVLQRLVELKQQQADCIGHDQCRYDPLLDEFEPGEKTARISEVLGGLRDALVPIVDAIAGSSSRPNVEILHREYPVKRQQQLSRLAAKTIGFDFQCGRLDTTTHPFCTELGPRDVRILTRFDERQLGQSVFGTLHEAGHGLYEQGLPTKWYGLPAGQYVSLGIHESQSRLWENQVGRSRPFWDYLFPRVRELFPHALNDVTADVFYEAVNDVRPSLIRVEADEATYNLHIIVRFELEQALLNDDLRTCDLPEAWNEKYHKYLGIVPDSDRDGVLQDVHWGAGLFGYFPTYSLGNLYAAQLFEAAGNALGDLHEQFSRGEFGPLRDWLTANIYQHGSCYSPAELIEAISGRPLHHSALIDYLRTKLSPIYGLD